MWPGHIELKINWVTQYQLFEPVRRIAYQLTKGHKKAPEKNEEPTRDRKSLLPH
jgi:hypothetical protein